MTVRGAGGVVSATGGRPAVLVATPFIWEGGPGRGKPTVHNLLRGFARRGYDVHVVTATNRAGRRFEERDGVSVHYFRPPFTTRRFMYDADHSFLTLVRDEPGRARRHLEFRAWWIQFVGLGARAALRLAADLAPAIAYGVNNPGVPVAVAAARRSGAVAIARIMGSEIAQVAGVDLDAPEGPVARGRPGPDSGGPVHGGGAPGSDVARRSPGLLRRPGLLAVRFDELAAFKLPCDAWVVTDDGQIGPRTLTGWLGVPADRLWLWRNGVDKERFAAAPSRSEARRRLGLSEADRVVLWVSQLTDWKHTERLLEALPRIGAAVPESRVIVVGDGPERSVLEGLTERLGVAERVRFEGFVTHHAMPTYYRAADVFTAFYDRANVSNTLLEAMLAGLPVVTLDNGLTREVVRHGDTGLLVHPGRLDQVAPALARVLADGALRMALGSAAAAWAQASLLTWDERIDREIDAIESLVASGSRRSRGRA